MLGNMMKSLRKLLSRIAIFMAVCALVAVLVTVFWWMLPLCSEQFMQIGRWVIACGVTLWLIVTKKLIIN